MYPWGWSGWLMLIPISIWKENAFEKNETN